MKIKSIEYSNFRNFKEQGHVDFSTDGKVTIVYGKNGDGKTTLHQLFQWILYNEVHFNKTASDKMYNLEFEKEAKSNSDFDVWGRIDFEHEGEMYSVKRTYTYKKELLSSTKIKEDFSIRKKVDNDWGEKIDKPQDFINTILPPGLSEYFFFDGESMIADLNQLGIDSADKLKTSLYTIFDLNKYQQAVEHIGRTDLKTTVIGKLFLDLGDSTASESVAELKHLIDGIQTKIEGLEKDIAEQNEKKAQQKELVRELSEKIGSRLSKEELEKQRNEAINERDDTLKDIEKMKLEFGEKVYEIFPKVLLSRKMDEAEKYIINKINKNELTPGINRLLLDSILNAKNGDNTQEMCICGRPLYHEQIERLLTYYKLLPPHSYKSLYDNFKNMTNFWGKKYDKDKVPNIIKDILGKIEKAKKYDKTISEITEKEKNSGDVEKYVKARKDAEDAIAIADDILNDRISNKTIYEKALKNKMKEYQKESEKSKNYKLYSNRIEVMEKVCEFYKEKIQEKSVEYSKKLETEIQSLINIMLTSKRKVAVTSDFLLKVSDSFDDESKSEGQFAIVSFAYIGGILKMLTKDDVLSKKEYPLVLDGPFSKLDPDQRQNVIDTIPEFAPQVILFSKDDLTDCFNDKPDMIGKVWTICSNDEKNVASIEEGFKWKK